MEPITQEMRQRHLADGNLVRALEALQRADRDRYLCALAAPAQLRPDLVTLYAFNAELAGIADKVSETMLGLIRLQWWRDALEDRGGGPPTPASPGAGSGRSRQRRAA